MADLTRHALVEQLKGSPKPRWDNMDEHSVLSALCFSLSLRLTLEIVPVEQPGSGTRKVEWEVTATISNLIGRTFHQLSEHQTSDLGHADPRLTLEYLESYHGHEVCFTDNLAKHLDIVATADCTILLVYKHKIFLRNELHYASTSLLPQRLLEETLDTLNLLLPFNDAHTLKFLKKYNMVDLNGLGLCGRRVECINDLTMYRCWGIKLARLSAVVADGPTGLRQLKPGRGSGANLREFANFWIMAVVLAALTVGFGTASVVLAVLQYNLSLWQYEIAVEQACAEHPDKGWRFCTRQA